MRFLFLFSLMLMVGGVCSAEQPVPLDPVTGMKMTGDWEVVRNNCIICHSPQTFLQQRGTEQDDKFGQRDVHGRRLTR